MFSFEAFTKNLERRKIETEIVIAQSRVNFWINQEKEYRVNPNKFSDIILYKLIRYAKSERKQAQSDLTYWKGILQS